MESERIVYVDKKELLELLEKKIKEDNERRMGVVDSDFIALVNDATEINDVVEVVRCKDCVHFEKHKGAKYGVCLYFSDMCDTLVHVTAEDYCSRGERSDGDGR